MALSVVGFSGAVYSGAAGIKPPVFRNEYGRFFSGDPDSPPSITYDRAQIEEYEQRGLLSLVEAERARMPGHVFLYAHELFVDPSLKFLLGALSWDERLRAHYAYISREEAVQLLELWARTLLKDALDHFFAGQFSNAEDASMRARFGATLEHADLRKEVFGVIAASRLARGESLEEIEGVIQIVASDFSEIDAQRVASRAQKLALRAAPHNRLVRFAEAFGKKAA